MVTSDDVVCMGRIDHERLVVVLAPPESYEQGRGYSFQDAHVYMGREGDLQPLAAEVTSMVDSSSLEGSTYVWCLQTSAGIFVSTFTATGRSAFVWSNAFNGGDILVHPLHPRYFNLAGEMGGAIRVTSKPRQVIYAGTNGNRIVAVTTVEDVTAAEFYLGDVTVPGCPMIRLPAADVVASREQYSYNADLYSAGYFSYQTVESYKHGQRELLGRREANRLFQTLNLPRKGYVALYDGLLQPIDVRRVRFNQPYGIAWIE